VVVLVVSSSGQSVVVVLSWVASKGKTCPGSPSNGRVFDAAVLDHVTTDCHGIWHAHAHALWPCWIYKMRAASFPSLLSQLIEGESSDDEAFSASPFNSPFAISGGRD
jgi:hypothetical protein